MSPRRRMFVVPTSVVSWTVCVSSERSRVLKLENTPVRWKAGRPIRVYAVDL